jgi:acyl-lipid (8-3)-desaturase
MAPAKTGKGRVITQDELSKHNLPEDAWVAVRDKVYDITDWVAKHPGGVDPLALNAGKDMTILFECYHTPRHKKLLEKYYIGEFGHSEYPTFPVQSEFYQEMKGQVMDHFKKKGYAHNYSPQIFVNTFFLLAGLFGSWYLAATTYAFSPIGLLLAAFSGVCSAFICFQPVHEGSHFATTKNPYVHRALGSLLDFCNGGSYYIWLHQHFLGHHPFTNVIFGQAPFAAADPDVLTNDPDMRRITPKQKWYDHYQYQHLYVPVLYAFLSIKFRIGDFVMLFSTKMNGPVRINPMPLWHKFAFWAGKITWFSYRIVGTALLCGSWWRAFVLYCVYDAVLSYVLAFVFQVNHVVPQADWPEVDPKTGKVPMDWAALQVRTTIDYSHDDKLVHFLTGGLNYQTVHHLFPFVSQVHYIDLGNIVKAACKKHDVKYNYAKDYPAALKSHIQHLKNLGDKIKYSEVFEIG